MTYEESVSKTINGIKSLVNQFPRISYGNNAIPYLVIEGYGNGQDAYNLLMSEFLELDFEKEIIKQKTELKRLELKHTNLTEIIGDQTNGGEGSVANQILLSLKTEIEQLIEKRDLLNSEISEKETAENTRILKQKEKEDQEENIFKLKIENLENDYQEKEKSLRSKFEKDNEEIDIKVKAALEESNRKITDAEKNATGKVKLINQFRDFLEETNKNMNLYSVVIIGILVAGTVGIALSIPNLLETFNSFDVFIKNQGVKITNWLIINYALGLLIVKLPWALCLSAVLTGMYSLLKGLLSTYEKINQDKRNMSAIYAISGNVAQSMNEYGISIAEEIEDEETGEITTTINVSKKDLNNKKESLRWDQIMRYFEGMQQHQVEIETPEDPTKVKLMSSILYKLIDRLPKA